MQELVVAHGQLLQFGPAVGRPLGEADGLDDFADPVVVEVGDLRVPAPTAPREPEPLALVVKGRDPLAHPRRLTRPQEGEMALLEREFGGDVAHEDVEHSVAIQVAEVDPHALERVAPDDLGIGRRQRLLPFQQGEAELAGPGPVVEQPVGAEVVGEVDLGQEVAVEVGGADRQGPTVAPGSSSTPSASTNRTAGSDPPAAPIQRSRCFRPPLSARVIECCIASSPPARASRTRASSGK